MEEKILEFGRLLRKGGLNISFSQIADALRATAEVGFQLEDFYHALACTMICEKADKPLFDKMFRLFFLTLPASQYDRVNGEGQLVSTENTGHIIELARSAEGIGQGRGGGASPALLLVKAVQDGNYSLLNQLAQLAFKSLGNPKREDLANLEQLIVQAKVSIGWYEAVNRLERIREKEKVNEITYSRWLECLNYLEDRIKELLEEYFVITFGQDALEEIASAANIREKEFYQLNNIEIDEIRKRITKLARKLASKYARRYRRAKHGEIDMRRTVRNALKTGGTPVCLRYRKKKLSKPEIVLLCDVSGSVAVFSEFMLQLVYTIQNRFRSVRSFLFVDRIEEVTNYFHNEDIEAALQEAFSKAYFSYSGFSDFGKVFTIFATKYLNSISPKSTLIILGDARNNWRSDERDFLKQISENVRKVLWFNPQPQSTWDTEDSIMKVYAPYCRQVFECRNLAQLEEVIEAIL
ncbi:MAG TPA: VWA domain-containing protein [Syntrophomonadaceae bacterium]|nr:VWA domain-containing protein [Syntrophomonadaceae bacterium]